MLARLLVLWREVTCVVTRSAHAMPARLLVLWREVACVVTRGAHAMPARSPLTAAKLQCSRRPDRHVGHPPVLFHSSKAVTMK